MIQNFDVQINLQEKDYYYFDSKFGGAIIDIEDFSFEFVAISYYYLNKFRRAQLKEIAQFKIRIVNNEFPSSLSFSSEKKYLFVYYNCSFSGYKTFSLAEKSDFQFKLVNYLLRETFHHFNLDLNILDKIYNELAENNWVMQIRNTRKKIRKGFYFELVYTFRVDAFIFELELSEDGIKTLIPLYRSQPNYFIFHYIAGTYNFSKETLKLGSKEYPIFEINLQSKSLASCIKAKEFFLEWDYEIGSDL